MKLIIPIALTAIACLIGAIVGYQLGHRSVVPVAHQPEGKPRTAVVAEIESPAAPQAPSAKKQLTARKRVEALNLDAVNAALKEAGELRQGNEKEELLSALLGRLAQLDPAAAIDFLANKTDKRRRHSYAYPVFAAIADAQGAQEAFQLYQKHIDLLEGQLRISSLFPIFSRWHMQDLDAALAAEPLIIGIGERRQMISTLCEAAADPDNREKLLAWAGGLESETERGRATQDIAETWARREDPEAVTTWLDANDLSQAEISGIERGIAAAQIDNDPAAAAEWLMSRANEQTRSEQLGFIVGQWANRAPNAAGEWLARQKLDAGADQALSSFVFTITRDDPESAYQWAKQITDPDRRDRSIEQLMRYWNRADPRAAEKARSE